MLPARYRARMAKGYLDTDDDIAALATPPGAGALAIVRTAGPACVEALAAFFSRPDALRAAAGGRTVHGRVVDGDGRSVDDVVVAVSRSPASYTGQDQADIMCHGGPAVTERLLEVLAAAGFRRALPGEFTFRAFAAGKLDLAQAEAVDELVKARTQAARAGALDRLSGSLGRALEPVRRELVGLSAALALALDYGDDGDEKAPADWLIAVRKARAACGELAETYAVGRLLRDGARVAVVGRTNAGKSSLFNRLLKEERAIVSARPGTTRDYIEADLDLGGVPVTLVDTAGVRDTVDPVEAEGVRRSAEAAAGADAVIYVVDATAGLDDVDRAFLVGRPDAVVAWNKLDLPGALPAPDGWLPVSAATGSGEPALVNAVGAALLGGPGVRAVPTGARISTPRQREALGRAAAALADAEAALAGGRPLDMAAVDVAAALAAIGELCGDTTPEDILETLFSTFCVGK